MNPIVEIEGAHSSSVWLIVIDEKIWGYVASADEVKSAFSYLAEKFIADIKKANPVWNAEAKQVSDTHMQIRCIQPGYVYNSEWIAHNFTAQQIKMYKQPNDNQSPILLPFPADTETPAPAPAPAQTVEVVPVVENVTVASADQIETKLEEMVISQQQQPQPAVLEETPTPVTTGKRNKKRSRQSSPSFTEKVVTVVESAVAKIEPLVEVVVERAVVPAVERAIEHRIVDYVPAVETLPAPVQSQLEAPTRPVSPPKVLTNSWEKRSRSVVAHISKYPQNRSAIKKKITPFNYQQP